MPNSATPACTPPDELLAPGHLGELTWQIPIELVGAVLAETGSVERRLHMLPCCACFPGSDTARSVPSLLPLCQAADFVV